MDQSSIVDLDVAALSEKLRTRELSAPEVTEAYLDRIAATEPRINAYITITGELAREAARRAEAEIAAGRWRGPFHGVPVGLKDLCYTNGILTTGGSKVLANFVPTYDATVWVRLREAGAVLLGKLNLHEFACGGTSNNAHFGPVRNPYDPARIPGGSSGGSAAAVAAHSNLATIGTDTRGSIRQPAALCGCVGLKPTYGRVSRYGVVALSYTLDHLGPITRTVRDAAMMLNVIAGRDPNDASSSREPVPDYTRALGGDLKGVRIGVIRDLSDWYEPEIERSFNESLKLLASLGAALDEVSIPSLKLGVQVSGLVARPEMFDYHQDWLLTRAHEYSDAVRPLIEAAMVIPAVSYIRAQRARALMIAESSRVLADHDVLVTPMCMTTAPLIGQELVRTPAGAEVPYLPTFVAFTGPFDCTGQPAISVPSGLSSAGLPIAIQIAGRSFDEARVLRVAEAFERARGPLPPPKL
ncbi:MAG TPA: amidase [Candidatus Binataceae bacterium]|nr:amidase [Candidatus Binataceae bacterium]